MIRLRPSGADEVLIKRVRDWYEPGPGVFIASTAGQTASFSPAQLFTTGVNGAWYDPSDTTTLFQDAAGTTSVTAMEQPVGLMLDKSKNGVGTNGAKRVNLLTYTEKVENAAWNKVAFSYSADTIDTLDPIGGNTADFVYPTTANASHAIIQTVTGTATPYVATIAAKAKPGSAYNWLRFGLYNGSSYTALAWFNVSTGQVGTVTSGTTITPVNLGNGWWKFGISGALAASASCEFNVSLMAADGGSSSYAGDGTSGIYIWGADLRLASEASTLPTYQRITDTWYNTLPGNHAFNPSGNSANFPVLSARYNLLTKSEHILDASIGQYLTTKISNTSWTFEAPGASRLYWSLSSNLTVGVSYRLSATFSVADIGKKIRFAYYDTGYNISPTDVTIDSSGYAEWVFTAVANTGIVSIYSASTGGAITYTFASGKGFSCTVANDALNQPAYQRVNTSSDYDTVGFKPYLKFNGNQWLQTNSIDFIYGDKMFVCAGVRKLSDATSGVVVELSTTTETNAGSFYILAPGGAGANSYRFGSRGTAAPTLATDSAQTGYTYVAPDTAVISGIGSISTDVQRLRRNGTQVAENIVFDQGIGTFGNYPLYIGARAGTSLWFNGRLYQLIVAGKQASDSEIGQTEAFTNQKTGAY